MRRLEERQRAAEEALQHDQLLAQFLGEYDATVVEGSIRPPRNFGESP
jgi:ferritin